MSFTNSLLIQHDVHKQGILQPLRCLICIVANGSIPGQVKFIAFEVFSSMAARTARLCGLAPDVVAAAAGALLIVGALGARVAAGIVARNTTWSTR